MNSIVFPTVALCKSIDRSLERICQYPQRTSIVVPGTPQSTKHDTYYRKILTIETKTPLMTRIRILCRLTGISGAMATRQGQTHQKA